MPFLWKCYIWVAVGVVGYIVGAARWALDKNRDKQNKNRWGLLNIAVTQKT